MTEPIYTEQWTYPPPVPAVVLAGGTATAGPDTPETFTMGGGFAGYPTPAPGARPPALFRCYDPRRPLEIFAVTATAGNLWTVRRATEGTPGLAHRPGFELRPFITTAGMGSIARGVVSRNGLIHLSQLIEPWGWVNNGAAHRVCEILMPAGEPIPGSVYEMGVWGYYSAGSAMTTAEDVNSYPRFSVGAHFGFGGLAGAIDFPVPGGGAAGCRFRVVATVDVFTATGSNYLTLWAATSNVAGNPVTPAALFGPTEVPPPALSITGDSYYQLDLQTPGAAPGQCMIQGAWVGRAA